MFRRAIRLRAADVFHGGRSTIQARDSSGCEINDKGTVLTGSTIHPPSRDCSWRRFVACRAWVHVAAAEARSRVRYQTISSKKIPVSTRVLALSLSFLLLGFH